MSRQDKATTERHTRTLRELVKQPSNKFCADCKRNDPRWASWNLGVYLCIRCSGIHRSMGTHISKVKSIDLDTWTPEQMENISKWGNRLGNLYWEAHLKAGHIPPEHKMDSFIRSKYDSKRWAMDGPPPNDPSVLDGNETVPLPHHSDTTVSPQVQQPAASAPVDSNRTQVHQLLSANMNTRSPPQLLPPTVNATTVQQTPITAPMNEDLFSLDFHPPAASVIAPAVKKDDIMSLFAVAPIPPQTPSTAYGPLTSQPLWEAAVPTAPPPKQQSMMGPTHWGAGSNTAWTAPPAGSTPNLWGSPNIAQPFQHSLSWASPMQQAGPDPAQGQWGFQQRASQQPQTTTNMGWENAGSAQSSSSAADPFAGVWGNFK